MDKYDLVVDNLGLIRKTAYKYYEKLKYFGLEYNDLYQAACVFLLENIEKYDSNKSSVPTFICNYTKYAILRYATKNSTFITVPIEMTSIAYSLLLENHNFYTLNNRYMNMDEVKAFLKPKIDKTTYLFSDQLVSDLLFVSMYGFNQKNSSLDEMYEYELENDVLDYKKVLLASDNSEEEAIDNITVSKLIDYLCAINSTTSDMYIKYHALDMNQVEIAREYGLCKQNISRRLKYFEKNLQKHKRNMLNIIK